MCSLQAEPGVAASFRTGGIQKRQIKGGTIKLDTVKVFSVDFSAKMQSTSNIAAQRKKIYLAPLCPCLPAKLKTFPTVPGLHFGAN